MPRKPRGAESLEGSGAVVVLRVQAFVRASVVYVLLVFGLFAIAIAADGSAEAVAGSVGLALVGVGVVLRACRSALIADSSGITIRNISYTKSWSWDEIGEVGWDTASVSLRIPFTNPFSLVLAVCPLRDPRVYGATATKTGRSTSGSKRREAFAAALDPLLARNGIANRILDKTSATSSWSDDPRSRPTTSTGAVPDGSGIIEGRSNEERLAEINEWLAEQRKNHGHV